MQGQEDTNEIIENTLKALESVTSSKWQPSGRRKDMIANVIDNISQVVGFSEAAPAPEHQPQLCETRSIHQKRPRSLRRAAYRSMSNWAPFPDADKPEELMYSMPYDFQDAILRSKEQSAKKLGAGITSWYQWRIGTDKRTPQRRSETSNSSSCATTSAATGPTRGGTSCASHSTISSASSHWGTTPSFVSAHAARSKGRKGTAVCNDARTRRKDTRRSASQPRTAKAHGSSASYAAIMKRRKEFFQGTDKQNEAAASSKASQAPATRLFPLERGTHARECAASSQAPQTQAERSSTASSHAKQRVMPASQAPGKVTPHPDVSLADVSRMMEKLAAAVNGGRVTSPTGEGDDEGVRLPSTSSDSGDDPIVKSVLEDAAVTLNFDLTPFLR